MSKSSNKTVAEQVNALIEQTGNPIDTAAAAAFAEAKANQAADAVDASIDHVERAVENQPLTADLIEDRVVALCMAANHVFFDPELRQEGDNGYAYALDYNGWDTRTDGAQPTGRIVTTDRLRFLDGACVYGICSNFEYQLRRMKERSDKHRASIQRIQAFAVRTGADMTNDLDQEVTKLERSVEQEAMLTIALNKSAECYHSITGKFFTTADDREAEKAKLVQAKKAMPPEQQARFARLGIA